MALFARQVTLRPRGPENGCATRNAFVASADGAESATELQDSLDNVDINPGKSLSKARVARMRPVPHGVLEH